MEGRANEEAREDYPIARAMVEKRPEPAQMGYEVLGTSPANMQTLVARFDMHEVFGIGYYQGELDEILGAAS